jgi:hypothetical protein
MTPDIRQPVFIVGLNKSGTSLLYVLLSNHPEFSAIRAFKPQKAESKKSTATLRMEDYGVGEGQKIPYLLDKLRPVSGSSGRFAAPEFQQQGRLTEADMEPGDRKAVVEAYQLSMVDPKLRLCEKSPPNILRTRYLQALFPDAIFFALVRNPFANVAANAKKRSKWGSVREQALHWAEAYRLFLEDARYLTRLRVINYEDLVSATDVELSAVANLCGLKSPLKVPDDFSIVLDINDELIGMLSESERAEIEQICGPVMKRFQRLKCA